MSRHPSKTQGFTLIEMMVVVAIIGIVAAAAGPGLTSLMADGRQASAAQELVRQARFARSESLRLGAAYLMRFDADASNELGTVRTFAGMTASCLRTDWAQAFDAVPTDPNEAPLCATQTFDMGAYNSSASTASDTTRQVITLRAQRPFGTEVTLLDVCYQPNGETYTRTSATDALTLQNAAAVFVIARRMGGAVQGVSREIVMVPGGSARFR